MYQELLAWTQADPLVSPEALPEVVSRALSSALPRAVAAYLQRATSMAPAASVPQHKVKGSVTNEKISVATFGVALCIVAMQVSTKSVLTVSFCDFVFLTRCSLSFIGLTFVFPIMCRRFPKKQTVEGP